jgi:acetyl esterase/lipase
MSFPMTTYRALVRLALALPLCALAACRLTDVSLWHPAAPAPTDRYKVERVRGVSYCAGPPANAFRHQLDLFLPRGATDYPVVMLVHGGGWRMGDKHSFGLYSTVAECLARQGIGVVLPNYRLSPEVQHPEHVRDIARAFAWVHAHIAQYGGSPDRLFLAGHSAGGHLVALLATDERYLKEVGLRTGNIRGVIGVSGVYRIPPLEGCLTLGGPTAVIMHLDQVLPLRCGCGLPCTPLAFLPGFPLRLNIFRMAFGNDLAVREDASPLAHVCPGLPPFLLISAEKDLPTLADMAVEFHEALRSQGVSSDLLDVKDRNHHSVLFRAYLPDDPVARAMCDFIGTAGVNPAAH